MNDLSGLEMVPELKAQGIASLKIEGRLRTAHYVSNVVQAYRLMIDAKESDLDEALLESSRLIEESMSRKVSPGYFKTVQPPEAITPFHSGNMGLHLGKLEVIKRVGSELHGRLVLKYRLERGDRLRCHFETTGERFPFTVKKIYTDGDETGAAPTGTQTEILLPHNFPNKKNSSVEIYKVDTRTRPMGSEAKNNIETAKKTIATIKTGQNKRIKSIVGQVVAHDYGRQPPTQKKGQGRRHSTGKRSGKGSTKQLPLECWLRLDSVASLFHKVPFKVDRFIVKIDQKNVSQAGQLKRHLGKFARDVIWALPPILLKKEVYRIGKLINALTRSGFRNFQIGHISQADLFGNRRVHLYGDYTLNLMNSQAVLWAETAGLEATQLSLELDRQCLEQCIDGFRAQGKGNARLGITVYGTPPLFTSRLAPKHFQYDKEFKSPKGELFVIKKMAGFTQTFAKKPFSILAHLDELKRMGLNYAVIDLSNMRSGKKELMNVADILSGKNRFPKLSTFNYLDHLE